VLSFLRREGDMYALVTDRAGEYAAEWTVAGMPRAKRWMIRRMPAAWRARAAMKTAARLVHQSYCGSRASGRLVRGAGSLAIRGSIFCGVRERQVEPLCRFYSAAIMRVFLLFNLGAQARVAECRAVGDRGCLVAIAVHGAAPAPESASRGWNGSGNDPALSDSPDRSS
jgi:hypothetical protein